MASPSRIILASKSPRRQYLLRELGLKPEVIVREVDESFPDHLKAQQIPLYLCKKKAEAFSTEIDNDTVVITADTIVWVDDRVFNKAENENEAYAMLKQLQGRVHQVFTGVCLFSKKKEVVFFSESKVYFRELKDEEIRQYIKEYKPFDKAGSYGAQETLADGINPCSNEEVAFLKSISKEHLNSPWFSDETPKKGFHIIDRIEGSYFNVMGLPVVELWKRLNEM